MHTYSMHTSYFCWLILKLRSIFHFLVNAFNVLEGSSLYDLLVITVIRIYCGKWAFDILRAAAIRLDLMQKLAAYMKATIPECISSAIFMIMRLIISQTIHATYDHVINILTTSIYSQLIDCFTKINRMKPMKLFLHIYAIFNFSCCAVGSCCVNSVLPT